MIHVACYALHCTQSVINCMNKLIDQFSSRKMVQLITLSIHLGRAKLTRLCIDRLAMAKCCKSRVWDEIPEGNYALIFGVT